MLRLMLLRHATAAPEAGGGDSERALTKRGRQDAQHMGDYLAEHGFFPDLAVVSPSRRTRETLELALDVFGEPCPVLAEPQLYLAEAHQLFALLRQTPAHVRTLLVVGHNPGLHDLALQLAASGEEGAGADLKFGLPTCGLIVLHFDRDGWADVTPHSGHLDRFILGSSLHTPISDL